MEQTFPKETEPPQTTVYNGVPHETEKPHLILRQTSTLKKLALRQDSRASGPFWNKGERESWTGKEEQPVDGAVLTTGLWVTSV